MFLFEIVYSPTNIYQAMLKTDGAMHTGHIALYCNLAAINMCQISLNERSL
jgi:hypothetical protein